MNIARFILLVLATVLLSKTAHAATSSSFFPDKDVEVFLANHFDLASIRSSLNPRRAQTQRTFADLGMKPSTAANGTLSFHQPGHWFYDIKILARRDVNRDGIEDLEVCFRDRAQHGGTYNSTQGLVLTRYSADSHVIAIRFGLENSECKE